MGVVRILARCSRAKILISRPNEHRTQIRPSYQRYPEQVVGLRALDAASDWRIVNLRRSNIPMDQFQYILKTIQPKTIDLSPRLWGITTEFVGFIPQSLVMRSIVLGWYYSRPRRN